MAATIRPLAEEIQRLDETTFATVRGSSSAKVVDESSLAEMRAHVLSLYQGVEAQHSFLDEAGQVFDCIPVEQQPSLRGKQPARAGSSDIAARLEEWAKATQKPERASILLREDQKDALGNAMWCPAGLIPMRRVRLEDIARFASLADFLQKCPGGGRHPGSKAADTDASIHQYAHGYQAAIGGGGCSSLNVWQPTVDPVHQHFSLSQQWWSAGTGASLQTIEVGWQVFPAKYGTQSPVVFIYWTPNDYATGGPGCYNLDGPGFVQTDNRLALGKAVPTAISVRGGTQYEIALGYIWDPNVSGWHLMYWYGTQMYYIGYYPFSLFGTGTLSRQMERIDFGGEIAIPNTPGFSMPSPPMGSGEFAATGLAQAAYQSDITYYPFNGGAWGGEQTANLTLDERFSRCFTITQPMPGFIFFGGPGGSNCPN